MWLTRVAINRPIVIWMALVAIGLLGGLAYVRLPVELHPRVPILTVTVVTVYPGAGPSEVEDQVTRVIEDAASTANGIRSIHSTSQESVSIVSISFRVGFDSDAALSAIRERMDGAQASLPGDARKPIVARLDINSQPVVYAALTGNAPLSTLRRRVDDGLKPRLARIPGVASVTISGGDRSEVAVVAEAHRLAQADVTIEDLVNAIRGSGRNIPAGSITDARRSLGVRAVDEFEHPADIADAPLISFGQMASRLLPDLPIPGLEGRKMVSTPLTVGDIAEIVVGSAKPDSLTRLDGRPSVAVVVSKAPEANSIAVADAVRSELANSRGTALPSATRIAVLRDESVVVRDALHDVNVTLVLGAALAVGIVLAFLRNLRGTVIVAVALPASLAATYLVIYFAGFTLNQMTLLALSLSVGILVDDSIVVLESITRHLRMGERPREAAFNGRTEIGFAGIALTLADVVVFLPIAFMGGIVGAFFREFGLTVATATLFSLLVSFAVTPALASRWYRRNEKFAVAGGARLDDAYGRALAWALQRPGWIAAWTTTGLAVALLLAYPSLGFEFLPASDQGQVTATIEMPPGSSLAATSAVTAAVEGRFSRVPEVQHTLATVGEIVGGFGAIPKRGPQYAQVNVRLTDRAGLLNGLSHAVGGGRARRTSDQQVAIRMRRAVADLAGARISVSPVRTAANVGSPIQLELRGQDLASLTDAASSARDIVASVPGVVNADVSVRSGQPEVKMKLDAVRSAAHGIVPAQAGAALRTALTGVEAGRIVLDGVEVPIRVEVAESDRNDPDALMCLPVGSSGGAPVLLGDIADVEAGTGPASIERVDGFRMVTVSADLAPGYALGNVTADVERRIRPALPPGITHRYGGESGVLEENLPHFVLAIGLAVVLLYLVSAALFNSLVYPLIMMLTLPMALIGALIALVVTGETLSLVSMIGVIMLIGLMGRNAILLIDYTNTLRARGLARVQALTEAGKARMRPIMMTTLTTIGGMLPVALRIGGASEIRAPMAVVVIGGLIVSTLLTLFVIPVAYDWADRVLLRPARSD